MERFIDYEGASSSTHRLSSSQTISQDVNLASNSSSRLSPNRENLGLKLRQDSASTEVTADRDYENFAKEAQNIHYLEREMLTANKAKKEA